ncbi:MAG: hypothetical protein EOR72_00180 [Mesorhizobium sp.]|uniref:hypothetical protein n=1 Tax=Mesorhizobium sp. TaxID=1871066 RepID=UPI000FE5CB33|nr:hypothetical protein [Mesorhizobium sp.]RWM19655.1 MAG: hypothetical protein EOR72_00180 [Mesorhizobium sp.]
MGVVSSLLGAKAWSDKRPWLKVEDRTGRTEFSRDVENLFQLAWQDAGQPFDALMFREKARTGAFYFTPEALPFFESCVTRLAKPNQVTIERCPRPWLYGFRLTLVAGTEVFWY